MKSDNIKAQMRRGIIELLTNYWQLLLTNYRPLFRLNAPCYA